MSSKTVILSGTLISALFMYYCINSKKDEVYAMLNPEKQQVETPQIENTPSIEEEVSQQQIQEENQTTTEIVQNTEELIAPINNKKEIILADPSFVFMNTKPLRFVSFLSQKDKESDIVQYIENICKTQECIKEFEYFDNRNQAKWQKDVKNLIKYEIDNNIQNGAITINENHIKIEGEVSNESQKNDINAIVNILQNKNFEIENLITTVKNIIPIAEEEKNITNETIAQPAIQNSAETQLSENKTLNEVQLEPKTVNQTLPSVASASDESPKSDIIEQSEDKEPVTKTVHNQEITEEEIQKNSISINEETISSTKEDIQPDKIIQNTQVKEDIGNMLNLEPITFKNRGNTITDNSKKVLDKIIELVNNNGVTNIEIMGYDNSSNDTLFSQIMGQKKADTVKRYLREHGVSIDIKSIGIGKDNSKSREIEIILKKGN